MRMPERDRVGRVAMRRRRGRLAVAAAAPADRPASSLPRRLRHRSSLGAAACARTACEAADCRWWRLGSEHHGRLRQPRTRPTHRARRAGLRPPAARVARHAAGQPASSTVSGCCRSTRSTCSSAATTCRLFSRVGAYDTAAARPAHLRAGAAACVEYWAHQASFIPRELWPLFEFRMEEYRAAAAASGAAGSSRTARSPTGCAPSSPPTGRCRRAQIEHDANERRGPWWGWSDVKRTLEWMFRVGEVVCVERRGSSGVYALPEQVLAARAARRRRRPRPTRCASSSGARRPPSASPPRPISPTTGA